jgi:hypothetical protein
MAVGAPTLTSGARHTMIIRDRSAVIPASASLTAGPARTFQTVNFANATQNEVELAATSPIFVVNGDILKFDASLIANGGSHTTGLCLCLDYLAATVNNLVIDPASA